MARTRRRFLWHYWPEVAQDAEFLAGQVQVVLDRFCDEWPEYYSDRMVHGYSLGLVEFAVTVTSRDQWWVAKRVRRLLTALKATELPVLDLFEQSFKLAPHTHRGKTYLEEVRSGSPD